MRKSRDQLIFNLKLKSALGRENFFISSSNNVAVELIDNWKKWSTKKMLLVGPEASGKTLLASLWATQSNARKVSAAELSSCDIIDLSKSRALVIENINDLNTDSSGRKRINEEALFHLLNSITHSSCFLLITGRSPSSSWNIQLPDLSSRLKTFEVAELFPPDDNLVMAVMVKQFEDRQIKVSPDFISFVSNRINRTFESIKTFVDCVDEMAMVEKREATIPFAKMVLDKLCNDERDVTSCSGFDSSIEEMG